jgi:hypothetical protein
MAQRSNGEGTGPAAGSPRPEGFPSGRQLIVIAKSETGLRARLEGVTSLTGADVDPLRDLLASEGATLQPLFGVSEERLNAEAARLATTGAEEAPALSVYYRVEASEERLDDLAESLRQMDGIEAAYVKPPAESAQVTEPPAKPAQFMLNEMVPAAEEPPVVTPDFTRRRGTWLRRRQEGQRPQAPSLLVDTEGFVLKAKVHSANVMDYEGSKLLFGHAGERFPRLAHLWLDGAYPGEDKGKDWAEKALGWTVEFVERPRKPAPEKVLEAWAAEWAKEGNKVDWQKPLPPRGFQVLPRRWVVEGSLAWICHNRAGWQKTTRGSVRAAKRVRVRCDELPYGKAVDSHLRPFHTVSLRASMRIDSIGIPSTRPRPISVSSWSKAPIPQWFGHGGAVSHRFPSRSSVQRHRRARAYLDDRIFAPHLARQVCRTRHLDHLLVVVERDRRKAGTLASPLGEFSL